MYANQCCCLCMHLTTLIITKIVINFFILSSSRTVLVNTWKAS